MYLMKADLKSSGNSFREISGLFEDPWSVVTCWEFGLLWWLWTYLIDYRINTGLWRKIKLIKSCMIGEKLLAKKSRLYFAGFWDNFRYQRQNRRPEFLSKPRRCIRRLLSRPDNTVKGWKSRIFIMTVKK